MGSTLIEELKQFASQWQGVRVGDALPKHESIAQALRLLDRAPGYHDAVFHALHVTLKSVLVRQVQSIQQQQKAPHRGTKQLSDAAKHEGDEATSLIVEYLSTLIEKNGKHWCPKIIRVCNTSLLCMMILFQCFFNRYAVGHQFIDRARRLHHQL